jgi:hypothetical protein
MIKLYTKSKIYIPSQLFKVSNKQEINGLIANNIIRIEQYNPKKHNN